MPTSPLDSDLPSLAAYFDAEGCIRISRNHGKYWQATVTIGTNDPSMICVFKRRFGASLYLGRKRRSSKNARNYWTARSDQLVRRVLTELRPFLNEKRAQAEAVLSRFSRRMSEQDGVALYDDLRAMKKVRMTPADLPPCAVGPRAVHAPCPEGCGRPGNKRGFCDSHYQMAKKKGRIKVLYPRGTPSARPFVYRQIPTEDDLRYFANYFDGDGHIAVKLVRGTWHLRVMYMQACPNAVVRMHAVYVGSLRWKYMEPPDRPQAVYQINARYAVLRFLHDIRPFVTEKQAQVELILSRYHDHMTMEEGLALDADLKHLRASGPGIAIATAQAEFPDEPTAKREAKRLLREYVIELLKREPDLTTMEILRHARQEMGFKGGHGHFYEMVLELRPWTKVPGRGRPPRKAMGITSI